MSGYISEKARIKSMVMKNSIILGGSIIGEQTFIDNWVCIGYPVRKKIRRPLKGLEELDSLSEGAEIGNECIIRSHTIIYERVRIGDRVETGHGVLVRENSRIGSGSRIGSFSQLDGEVWIGENVNIQSMVYLPHLTVIDDNAFIGPNVVVTNDLYPVSKRLEGVKIGKGVVVGAGSVLLAGIEIGERAVVAAGAVVTKNIPPGSVVVGAPARVRMTREKYEERKRLYEAGLER